MSEKLPIDYCYHTHTFRCGHAEGLDEEYVLSAIKKGIKVLGFTDHVILPDRIQPHMRGDPYLFEGYVSSILSLKEKYKKQIKILLGFECEWFPEYLSYYQSLLKEKGFDYLIIGNHCAIVDNNFKWFARFDDPLVGLETYTQGIVDALESGFIHYIAHPDHFMSWYPSWDEHAIASCKRIAEAALKADAVLELNMGPSRQRNFPERFASGLIYPNASFWEMIGQMGNKVLIGTDAHSPDDFETSDYPFFMELAKAKKLNLISRLKLSKE